MDFWKVPMSEKSDETKAAAAVDNSNADAAAPAESTTPVIETPAGLLEEIKHGRGPNSPTNAAAAEGGKGKDGKYDRGYGKDEKGFGKGASGKRGWRGKGWRDFAADIPERPKEAEVTEEKKKQVEDEQRKLAVRDQLRSATTADELNAAIASAEELGMTQEVALGKRKLSKIAGG